MKLTQRGTLGLAIMAGVALTGAASQATFGSLIANDNASNPAYTGGWSSGSNGGYGFGAWSFGNTGGTSGEFIGSSGDIDTILGTPNSPNPTSPISWGMYSDSNSLALASRSFTEGAMTTNQQFSILMENQGIKSGGSDGINLTAGGNNVVTLLFVGGGSDYQYQIGNGSLVDTGLGYTTNGISIGLTMTSSSTATLTLSYVTGAPDTKTISLTGLSGGPSGIKLFSSDAGPSAGTGANVYFNSASITAVPEPATLGMLAIGGIGLLTARRRK